MPEEPLQPADETAATPDTQSGDVEIGDNVIAKIAYEACREVEGIHALGGATSRALSSLRGGGDHRTTGVSIDLRENVVDVDLTLVILYGRSIPQVAQACREAVRERIETITGLTVKSVNVVVSDIFFPEAADGEQPGQG